MDPVGPILQPNFITGTDDKYSDVKNKLNTSLATQSSEYLLSFLIKSVTVPLDILNLTFLKRSWWQW